MAKLELPEGLEHSDMECVMLDVEPLDVLGAYGMDVNRDDLFYGQTKELKYAQGAVGASGAHVTLLYGIHPSETYFDDVMSALDGWYPEDIMIRDVGFFPTKEADGTLVGNCVVANVIPSANLMNARRRLEALPYSSKFDEYRPHITLAYLKLGVDLDAWIRRMNAAFSHRVVVARQLNLGLDDVDSVI